MGNKVKTLSTKRLILREVNLSHEQDYFEGFVDYEVIRNMNSSNVTWPYPKTGVRDFLESHVLPNQGKTLWQWGIFLKESPDKLIGSINLGIDDEPNRGFWLARKYWGHGYMTEAVEVINQFAFEELGFEKLIFANAKGNERSRRIKEKTGGLLVKICPMNAVDPSFKESEVWELTKEEWKKHRHGKSI